MTGFNPTSREINQQEQRNFTGAVEAFRPHLLPSAAIAMPDAGTVKSFSSNLPADGVFLDIRIDEHWQEEDGPETADCFVSTEELLPEKKKIIMLRREYRMTDALGPEYEKRLYMIKGIKNGRIVLQRMIPPGLEAVIAPGAMIERGEITHEDAFSIMLRYAENRERFEKVTGVYENRFSTERYERVMELLKKSFKALTSSELPEA